jgi:hypothetical protein
MARSAFISQARRIERTQRRLFSALADSLRKELANWTKHFLAARLSGRLWTDRCDVPLVTATNAQNVQAESLQINCPAFQRVTIALVAKENGDGHRIERFANSPTRDHRAEFASRDHRSRTITVSGFEQQISAIPSAGKSIGSGR